MKSRKTSRYRRHIEKLINRIEKNSNIDDVCCGNTMGLSFDGHYIIDWINDFYKIKKGESLR